MPQSNPWKRFLDSTHLDYEKWHEGIPYDMNAFRELQPDEQFRMVAHLKKLHAPNFDWRDIEVFQAARNAEILHEALTAPSAKTRLSAAEALRDLGAFPHLNALLAKELSQVTLDDGLTPLLDLLEKSLTPPIRDALLINIQARPDVAVHLVAKLMELAGHADSDFDWNQRPFFLRFGDHSPPADRAAALAELCQKLGCPPPVLVNSEPKPPPNLKKPAENPPQSP